MEPAERAQRLDEVIRTFRFLFDRDRHLLPSGAREPPCRRRSPACLRQPAHVSPRCTRRAAALPNSSSIETMTTANCSLTATHEHKNRETTHRGLHIPDSATSRKKWQVGDAQVFCR